MPTTIRDMLHLVVEAVRPAQPDELLSSAQAAPGRPDDVPWLVGDPSKFIEFTGSNPQRISLISSIREAVEQSRELE
jgi:hypothetical protein